MSSSGHRQNHLTSTSANSGNSSSSVQHGAALQTFNNELVRCLDELCHRRNDLQKEINKEEKLKSDLEFKLHELQKKLDEVNLSLESKVEAREKYDKTINESETAYMKILESSQVLLNVVKKDAKELEKN